MAAYQPATAEGPAQNVPVPMLPEKAKEFSKEGLIAFAEYWYETLGYVYETGDSAPMMAVTEAGCKTCAFINEPVGELYKTGGWVVGGKMTVHEATSTFQELPDGTYQAVLMIQQTKVSAYSVDKSLTTEHPQHKARANIVVARYLDDQWRAQTAEALTED
ncbi:hypothetical protein CVS27_10615 [Arthrobacter glacialis]|uniref:DUF6318 domain-containing protein n=1 Tax=Arthrobacter glacialis TaxID=1664 RepID=A0A2S3ZW92_ARTGL|nr:hypothetical protein CVS27_10615 [Arthrobacter glacialis]